MALGKEETSEAEEKETELRSGSNLDLASTSAGRGRCPIGIRPGDYSWGALKVSQAAGSPDSQALAQPADAHLRRAVGPGLGGDVALRLLLDHVVADGRGRAQALLHVARLEDLLVEVAVDAGEAVGLQLEADRVRVRLLLRARAPLRRLHLVGDAEQVLDVVADLVGDDVGRAKSPGAPKRWSARGRTPVSR